VGLDEGARIWDLDSGREMLALPSGTLYVFFEGRPAGSKEGPVPSGNPSRKLLTGGSEGFRRWPIETDGSSDSRLRLGPPELISADRRVRFARTVDNRTLVAATQLGGPTEIFALDAANVRRKLGSHPDGGVVRSLSSDGLWAASCGWHSDSVRLWNVATGTVAHEWLMGKRNLVFFTPDSRALIIASGDEFSFWDVQTHQLLRRLSREGSQFPGWVAFAPDGQLMALEMAPGIMHLVDIGSGRTVARLADPHGDRATWQGFSPDGTRLAVVARHDCAVHIWDLASIRARLRQMNLDWAATEFPPR
jgi:WD40 repeat protein